MRLSPLLIYGFSIFSMFFGSGNLVFPLQIGVETGADWLLGFGGLFISGIVLPLLGLLVIKKYKGDYELFFASGGKIARYVLPLFTLSLLGSFGVLPRCITVAHGGIEYIYPEISLLLFGLFFSIASYIICLKDHWMISILGKILTPLLLGFLAFLITWGIWQAPPISQSLPSSQPSFVNGFFQGYKMMDLLAAFFFSAVIFKQIEQKFEKRVSDKTIMRTAIKASFIGAALLALVYIAFVYMGAAFKNIAQNVSPELILPAISFHLLGKHAGLILSIIIILSCLTTAVALNNIYARYLTKLLKLPVSAFPWVLVGTTVVSYGISLLDFKGISAFLNPILEVTYPALILLTVLSIITRHYEFQKKVIFYGAILVVLYSKFFL